MHFSSWRTDPRPALKLGTAIILLAAGCDSKTHSAGERVDSTTQALSTRLASDAGTPSSALAASTAGTGSMLDAVERIQSMLDARYTAHDVKHTFETLFGETIDCVDYYAQPAAKALITRGMPVPSPSPRSQDWARARDALPDFMLNGKPDRLGRARACPEGTVPILHMSVDDVLASGGIDGIDQANALKGPPPGTPNPCVNGYHAHVQQRIVANASITSTTSKTSIYAPAVPIPSGTPDIRYFSLSQTWTYTGTGYNKCGATCTTDCLQTVEAGWVVYPYMFAMMNPSSPHFFIFSTSQGYGNGCWNDVGDHQPSCRPGVPCCLNFLLNPEAGMILGATLPPSVVGNTPIEFQVSVDHSSSDGWCITAGVPPNVTPIGCYPNSNYSLSMPTAASMFKVGGEVCFGNDPTDLTLTIPMGSGRQPSAGYTQAAYHRDFEAYVTPSGWSHGLTPFIYLDKLWYGMSTTAPAGGAWTNWFYFGTQPVAGWFATAPLMD